LLPAAPVRPGGHTGGGRRADPRRGANFGRQGLQFGLDPLAATRKISSQLAEPGLAQQERELERCENIRPLQESEMRPPADKLDKFS